MSVKGEGLDSCSCEPEDTRVCQESGRSEEEAGGSILQASEEAWPCCWWLQALVSDLCTPELRSDTALLLKPPAVWSFDTALLGHRDSLPEPQRTSWLSLMEAHFKYLALLLPAAAYRLHRRTASEGGRCLPLPVSLRERAVAISSFEKKLVNLVIFTASSSRT